MLFSSNFENFALISTSSPFDVKLMSPDGTFLTMSERSLFEKQQVPSSTTVHGHSLMIVNSVSVETSLILSFAAVILIASRISRGLL